MWAGDPGTHSDEMTVSPSLAFVSMLLWVEYRQVEMQATELWRSVALGLDLIHAGRAAG